LLEYWADINLLDLKIFSIINYLIERTKDKMIQVKKNKIVETEMISMKKYKFVETDHTLKIYNISNNICFKTPH
jgi:hypothetical protein